MDRQDRTLHCRYAIKRNIVLVSRSEGHLYNWESDLLSRNIKVLTPTRRHGERKNRKCSCWQTIYISSFCTGLPNNNTLQQGKRKFRPQKMCQSSNVSLTPVDIVTFVGLFLTYLSQSLHNKGSKLIFRIPDVTRSVTLWRIKTS